MIPDWLDQLITNEDRDRLKNALTVFDAETGDRTALVKAAQSIEDLEKALVARNPDQLIEPYLQHRILVCTVGLRPMPVILTARIVMPKKLYLLHTTESRRIAEQIRDDLYIQELGLDPVNDVVLRTISLVDAPANYDHLRRIVSENAGSDLVVDISGGVKVMGTSLAAAAFWLRIPVVYQLGEEFQGVIRPFSERLMYLQNPFAFFGSTELRSIQGLFHSGDYDAALTLARNLREDIGDVTTLGRLDILIEFIEIYRDWDGFLHSTLSDTPRRRLAGRLRAIITKLHRMKLDFADLAKLNANLRFLTHLEQQWKPEQRSLNDRYRVVDLFVSARRRASAGKHDDGTGRLYRCLEMAASICLVNDCAMVEAKNPNFDFFINNFGNAETFHKEFQKKATYELPQGRPLGLKDQMTLLAISPKPLHKQIGGIFQGMESKQLIDKRNRSILAHGTVAVSLDEYQQFEKGTSDIISRLFDTATEFEQIVYDATHPPIEIEI